MKAIKNIVYMALYALISIIKAPFGLIGSVFSWIEKLHVNLLRLLIEWAGDDGDKRTFNAVLDFNAATYKTLGERWFLPMKFEL